LRRDEAGTIDLVWIIEHATLTKFGATVLAGDSRLPAALIRRELLYDKGQVWDQKKVDRSVARLKALGIFDKVTLQPVPARREVTHGDAGLQDVVLTCVDDDPFELRLRAGMECVGQYFEFHDLGFCGGGSLVWKNPFNRADRIELAIDVGPQEDYGQLSYIRPRFFDWPLTTTTSVYVSRFGQPLVTCFKDRLYRLEQDGCSLELEYADNGDKFGCCFGFEAMRVSDISRRLAELIDFSPRLVGQWIPYFYAEPVLVKNYVDDLVNPTWGTIFTITGKGMASLSHKASGFLKILLEESIFLPLNTTATWVGAVHLRAGHIFNSDFETIMPPERFYLGGAYSLRGYDTDMAPPVDIAPGRACCLLPIGGKTVLSGMFEVRFPLYKALGGVFFNDCGILVRKQWKDDNFVGATGFGLRYTTPVGPLRFDIAWKWRRQKGEEHRFAWFLTLGQAF
jgi:outer membrane protein assembly factor BamA